MCTNVIKMCLSSIKNNNGMTHCRKGDLKNISLDFTSERYYKKARAQTKLGKKKKRKKGKKDLRKVQRKCF